MKDTRLIGIKSTFWDKLKEINWKGRKIKESIYINSLNPTMKIDPSKLMNLEKGFDLDPIWSEFNPVFRDSIQKKIGNRNVV